VLVGEAVELAVLLILVVLVGEAEVMLNFLLPT
jgi:hypothetical protein